MNIDTFMDELRALHPGTPPSPLTACHCGACLAWWRGQISAFSRPEPEVPRNESFDDWSKRTAALIEECQERRR